MSDVIKYEIVPKNEEDKFFIFNKIFRSAHFLSRKESLEFLLGYNNNLLIYSSKENFDKLIEIDDIKRLKCGKAFSVVDTKANEKDFYLERVNNKFRNPDKKLKQKRQFLSSKGLSEEQIKHNLSHYKEKLQSVDKDTIYFIAFKKNMKISIFAKKRYGLIFPFKTNTYGLKRKID